MNLAANETLSSPAAVPAVQFDADWVVQARQWMADSDARLAERFVHSTRSDRLLALRARAADRLLQEAWERCVPAGAQLALFAVGGYGRGELFPHSDIDLLVLANADAQQAHHGALSRFFALLWDAGLPASHAVRSPAQCTQAAVDQTVLTALIEARPLVADATAVQRLDEAIATDQVWPPHEFFDAKREEMRQRHARFGDTSENLEPNLKDGPGGLRDLHTLGWMALRTWGVHDLEQLVGLDQLGADEARALRRERIALSRLRYGLHLVAGRPEERLRFDYQKTLAAKLGFADDAENLGVEKMMQGFYRSALIVRRVSDRMLQRFEEQFDGGLRPERLDERFDLYGGYLAARDKAWPRGDIGEVFALFAAWAANAQVRGLRSHTARALAEALPRLPAYIMATPAARAAFMALLRGPRAVDTLTRMARLGVLGQWIPAFARVSGRMQFDLFHVYTVDQHTLMVLGNLAGFASAQANERFSIAHEVWPRLRKPELLLLAGLFHDIAKGRGGDHSELGAVDAHEFCVAHGLSESDTELVTWLVEQHLRMSVTAQKQDISDADVIARFAALVGDRDRLDYLYLLTCADIAGTSPKLWNAWKDRLLADLYFATRRALREGGERAIAAAARIAEAREAARVLAVEQGMDDATIARQFAGMPDESFLRYRPEQLAWQAAALSRIQLGETQVAARRIGSDGSAMEVFVFSPDRDGLFAAILATLDRMGFAIHQARVLDAPNGMVFDTFEILPADNWASTDPEEVSVGLHRALAGQLDKVRASRRALPRQLRHFRFAPKIEFAATPDGRRTLLSLVAPDRPGLLADVARTLRECQLRVHGARIATFGERAEDVFQITDESDRPLDESAQDGLRKSLQTSIAAN
ncbi:MAG: [protein-PII] uridylyltransferase [Pseudoxanthomonas sp.]